MDLVASLEDALGSSIAKYRPVHGGDFARSYRLDLDDSRVVFAKTHSNPPPNFFETEAEGLNWLRQAQVIGVPEVLAIGKNPAYLALEWLEVGSARPRTEVEMGRSLAALHRAGAPSFGRQDRRATGSLALPNDPTTGWAEFYASRRLLPLAKIAADRLALPRSSIVDLEHLATRLETLVGPDEPPARLHGDLWAGNRVVDTSGRNWLVDPASFGGHREFDLAMMHLFGGFSDTVFASYSEEHPLDDGWLGRIPLYQVAPLVVHAIKFGGSYVAAATNAISQYL